MRVVGQKFQIPVLSLTPSSPAVGEIFIDNSKNGAAFIKESSAIKRMSSAILTQATTLSSGVDNVTVSFTAAFASAPIVSAIVKSSSSTNPGIIAFINTISTSQVNVLFSSPIPDGTYTLNLFIVPQ